MRLNNLIENVAVIGGYRENHSKSKNEKHFGSLIKDIRELGLSFTIQSGKWRSKNEPSIKVKGISYDQAKNLMNKYKQDAIVYNGELITKKDLE